MTLKKALVASLVTMAFAGSAAGQTTLGEILDKGAKKLSHGDFVAMLPATSFVVFPSGSGEAEVVYKADGTFSGSARHYGSGTTSGSYGTWKVDESGKFCVDENLPGWSKTYQDCNFRFKVGDELFDSPSDSDRNAKLNKRKITKTERSGT